MCPSPSKERSKSPARKYIRVESPAVVNPNKRSLGCEVRLGVVMVILAMDASTEYLFAPMILGRLRIPHIIGMILAGVLVGKYGFNIMGANKIIISTRKNIQVGSVTGK